MANVAFDGEKRTITVTTAPDPNTGAVEVDVQKDLYSEAKRQWLNDSELIKHPFPFRTVGGDPLSPTLKAGAYFFLNNNERWRIVPYDADHEAIFVGNLYRENVNLPLFKPPQGGHSVAIRLETSSLTQLVDVSSSPTSSVNVVSVGGVAVANPDDLKADLTQVESDLADVKSKVASIYDVEFGRWAIEDDGLGRAEWVIYAPDNTTELARFELDSKTGRALFGDIPDKTFMGRRKK